MVHLRTMDASHRWGVIHLQVATMALYDGLMVHRGALPAADHTSRQGWMLARGASLAAVLGAYVWLRHTLTGGQQLVKVFRKVGQLPRQGALPLHGHNLQSARFHQIVSVHWGDYHLLLYGF